MYISIHHILLWHSKLSVHWASDVPLMFRQLPPVVKSANWMWFGEAHTCLYDVPQLTVHVRAKTKPWCPRNCLETSETGQFQGTEPQLSGSRLFHFGIAIVRKLMKNPMVTLTELSVERGKPSRSTTISVALHQSGQCGSNQTEATSQ